jgi:eukaryotic-like serine/threonine-protein kinase
VAHGIGYVEADSPQGTLAVNEHQVGAYELGPLLGSGTVGAVYRARNRETGQPAVIKLLQAQSAAEPELQLRFVREVAIAEKLDHPNIVRHYDCGLCDDQIYFAMELVECGTLKDVLRRRGTLGWREAVAVAIQVCDALEHAHRLGIIHRDLKPANLFLAADGKVKIGDFGLARDLNSHRLTMEGQTVGTCRYMPPEQIAGEDELTGAVDLYALGCLVFEMLVGRPPFDGDTVIQVFEAHLYSEPTPLVSLVRDCPQDLSELVLALLAKQPDERPQEAVEVRAALANILAGISDSRSRSGVTAGSSQNQTNAPERTATQPAKNPSAATAAKAQATQPASPMPLTTIVEGASASTSRKWWILAGIATAAAIAIIIAVW